MSIDRIKTLTADELQTLFMMMEPADMLLIVNALRALVGDTESLHKLQRLHVSIEQGLHKLLKAAGQQYDFGELETRFFRPVDGFANGKQFVEVRTVSDAESAVKFEVLSHFDNGKVTVDDDSNLTFQFIRKQVHEGLWEEINNPLLDNAPAFLRRQAD